ncbi:hypothetical protein [Mycobacterium sp. URHB0044]|jgi:hypothetical protein|uniref:hypothetical protein n=1 Tax=Mycobacterium sp. URHB0044 TaxID=1380386 RepID=UPI0005675359|nr:hypothetical protein [Mycobacterium sp. URHB0044]
MSRPECREDPQQREAQDRSDAYLIAAGLAAASEVFPILHGEQASRADVSAEGDVITVVVTDHRTVAKREYRAEIRLVGETSGGGAP